MLDLNILRARLVQMRVQLTPFMDAYLIGAPEKKEERDKRIVELFSVGEALRIMVRDIQNAQNLLAAQQSGLYNVPRDQRTQAADAIKGRQRNLDSVRKEAEALAEFVRDLLEKNGFLTPIQAGMKFNDLVENFVKNAENAHTLSELGLSKDPAISQAHDTSAAPSIIPVVIFIYLDIKKLKDKLTGSKADEK